MKKYSKSILVGLLIISVGANVFYYRSLANINEKIIRVNTIVASNVERNIRQSIMYTQDLIETGDSASFQNLERAIGNLTLSFNHWVDLNQSEKTPNERMQRGLASVETLRNLITHHLANQYKMNDKQLTEYDIDMLEKVNDQMKRLLLVYHNIENRLLELKDPIVSDGGLVQIANNFEEINRLYRHSKLPNRHPEYIDYTEAVAHAERKIPYVQDYILKEEKDQVIIREGVHYYELNYYDEDEEIYTVWIDAMDGLIRNYELKRMSNNGNSTSQNQAITIARDFVGRFYQGQLKEEMFYMENRDNGEPVYSFRFTPIKEELLMVSDAYIVNVNSATGNVIKYTNDFTDTMGVNQRIGYTEEDIMAEYKEEFGEMDYNGLAITRSFYTHYQPRLTYSFRINQDQQETMVFVDVTTGMLVYQLYYVYHPIL
ncbi:hypothetical protein SAMN05660297_00807 [Natronincola peptidivorans]|uniref:YcdB/YcdC repeated domain-containing protein n=1 Tax=Natronincola peptidivorans TaxID=426128 RepID=A0A1I0A083_9FIRM|nr:YcdB/YcdC domain-containing protein [Natronincola peptidivorans]SES87484.1 hypothetical protein SAMN05660297_00807 [Natronincola peptidivorans]